MVLNVTNLLRSSPDMCKSLKLYFAPLIVLAMCTLSAMAQSTTTGAIGGTVMNPAKDVVPGASVSVKSTATNRQDATTSDGDGRSNTPNLQPGAHPVTVNPPGVS